MTTVYAKPEKVNVVMIRVALMMGIEPREMKSESRQRDRVLARRVAVYVLRRLYPKATNRQIANWFGRTDHTWVTEAVKVINELSSVHPQIATQVQEVTDAIMGQAEVKINLQEADA